MRAAALFALVVLAASCAATDDEGEFVPDVDDETIDPADPPIDPDPFDDAELLPPEELAGSIATDDAALARKASCPKRTRTLSPKGLTFVIHISKHEDEGRAALRQLERVRHLIRARDVFMIERRAPWVLALREAFPCNDFHFIAFPDELANAFDAAKLVDGVVVDWEKGVFENPQSYSIDKLDGYANKIRGKGLAAGVAPFWPRSFDDGRIVRAANMHFELAQIQDDCAHGGAAAFAASARALTKNFLANGLSARDVGFEISLASYADADNHTGVDRSAGCTRKAYGKGARAIYLYGNGQPHYDDYFHELARLGVRTSR